MQTTKPKNVPHVTISTTTTAGNELIYVVHTASRPVRTWERQPGSRRYATSVDLGSRTIKVRAEYRRGDQFDRPRFVMTLGAHGGELLYPAIGRPTRMTFARGPGVRDCPDVFILDHALTFALDKSAQFRPGDST